MGEGVGGGLCGGKRNLGPAMNGSSRLMRGSSGKGVGEGWRGEFLEV